MQELYLISETLVDLNSKETITMKHFHHIPVLFLLLSFSLAFGQPDRKTGPAKVQVSDVMSSATFSGLELRSVGPAFTGGRIVALAVDPNNRAHYYVGVASAGVWETYNDGTSWTPVFEHEPVYSVGALAMDPKNPFVVWVGTGEANSQRSVGWGDGIYKTLDGGKHWTNMGLKTSEHIGKILIDPQNPNIVYVAAQGPLWGPGGDRGLYKTTDGGKTWKDVLKISENTGVNDVEMDPTNHNVLYASTYERRRHTWGFIDGGPESGIYKSTDAGETWTKLNAGLPTVDMGKIGLAVSPVKPSVLYATIEAAEGKGGIFRSTDYGETWQKMNSYNETAMYYGVIYADPKNVNRIYLMGTYLMYSDNGGKTMKHMDEKWKHVDSHVMYIDPSDPDYYLVGCDGGLYESYDRAKNWDFKSNLPITQFYDVDVDNSKPFFYVYGGTQDNNSVGGPSQTMSASGIVNSDWFITVGGDGFESRVDPVDPNTVYAESQYGGLVRYNRKTEQMLGIQPVQGKNEAPLRWEWDSPIIISPFDHNTIYFGANKLFKSTDRGDSWTEISGDLTRQIDVNKLKIMGRIWGPDAVARNTSTSFYGTLTSISESPLKRGLLYVGTDDGLIQVTDNGGKTWRKIDKFPGVPELAYVTRVIASKFDVNTVYAAFDNHKNEDFKPYLLKSADQGRTWTSISSNLPEDGPVLAFAQDYKDPNLLFAGTEFGLFFSNNGGEKWIQLKGNMPTIPVRDLAIQQRECDLVAATFGRGFYVLDNYAPLRLADEQTLSEKADLFPVRNAMMYVQKEPLGDVGKAAQGESYFTAPNPPFGATFTYYLKNTLQTAKQVRLEEEAKAVKSGAEIAFPTNEQLTAEGMQPQPVVELKVTDESGNVVRRVEGPSTAGIHRVSWDLRYPSMVVREKPRPYGSDEGSFVMPGKYTAALFERMDGKTTQLSQPQSFDVYVAGEDTMPAAARAELVAFQEKVTKLHGAIYGALQTANQLEERLGLIEKALNQSPSNVETLRTDVYNMQMKLDSILIQLRGNETLQALSINTPPSISDRIETIMYNESMSTARPPQTDIDSYNIASEEFTQQLGDLRTLVNVDLRKLESEIQSAGSPWTPGTLPDWKNE